MVLLWLIFVFTITKIMKKERSSYKSHWHCVFHLKFHLVLVTKYRKKCLTDKMLARLRELCEHVCKKWDVELVEFGGESDHVHLLLDMHPNAALSRFVNNLKTVTSRLLRKEFSKHLASFYDKPVLWTRAYCIISAGGAPLSVLSDYIQKQGNH